MEDHQHSSAPAQPIVHVGNLSFTTTSYELQALFASVAPVVRLTLRQKADNASAFAFVTFSTLEDCENVIKEFNYYMLHNKQMIISMLSAEKSDLTEANIFVKNLPPNLNSKDLHDIFKMFGQILSCKVASNSQGELKGYGYVQYKNAKSAKKAIANCKNVKIGSHVLEVKPYAFVPKEEKAAKETVVAIFTNCYVKNFPRDMTEEELAEILSAYGKVTSLFFPLKDDGEPVGYACANFETPESAAKAIENLHGKQIFRKSAGADDKEADLLPFYIQKAESKKERVESIKKQAKMFAGDAQTPKCNLYVSNIPESFSNGEIRALFEKFGKISAFKIASAGQDTQKQYGYICYFTPEEAAVAYEKLNGTLLDGSKLHISYYKPKAERQAESEALGLPGTRTGISNKLLWLETPGARLDAPTKRVLHVLYDTLMVSATDYEEYWSEYNASDASEFSQRMVLSLVDYPFSQLKEMVNDPTILSNYIRRTSRNIKDLQSRLKSAL